MVSALDFESSGPGSSPGLGHCVVFLEKTLLSQCLSPARCTNGYRRIQCCRVTPRWIRIPSRGEVGILLVAFILGKPG